MVFLVDRYVEWVRTNEALAVALERMSRGLSMFLVNPDSLVSMESAWTLTKVHALSNQMILSTANRSATRNEKWNWALQLIKEVECLAEIALRHLVHHRAGWIFVIVIEVTKAFVRSMVHRGRFAEALVVARGLLLCFKKRPTPPSEPCADSQLQRPKPSADLVIPRVIARGTSSEHVSARTTWADVFAVIVDAYLLIRPVVMASVAFRAFPAARQLTKQVTVHEDAAATGAAAALRTVAGLRRSLSRGWGLWRTIFALDIVALVVSVVVRKQRAPVLVMDNDNAKAHSASDAFGLASDPELESGAMEGSSNDETAEDVRIATLKNAIFYGIFREPFFSVILKNTIYRHFVDGFFNRWIPLIGPLLANQVRYMLTMQECSYLYTLSSGAE